MTLSEWLEQMVSILRPSTLDHYRRDMNHHVKPYLGQKKLTQITPADLRKLYDTLKQHGRVHPRPGQSRGLSTTTVHSIHTTLHAALDKAVDFVRRDPERYLPAVLRIVERLDGDHMYQDVYDYLRRMLDDKDNNARAFAMRMLREADPLFLRRFVSNFLVRSGIIGYARQKALSAELDCNIPWAILMDPTSACNLHCTGCWAADYDHGSHLPYEVLDRIVREGTELGTHFYLFSGGEPLVRKNVALRLCREHPDCFFLAFTNGTLVDEEFADALREVGNFTLAF